MASPSKTSIESLPKQFVESMRVLFNILDEKKTGLISIQDIQMRWQDGKVLDLPSGVLSALMKVTPSNGYINFDRFVAGLQVYRIIFKFNYCVTSWPLEGICCIKNIVNCNCIHIFLSTYLVNI